MPLKKYIAFMSFPLKLLPFETYIAFMFFHRSYIYSGIYTASCALASKIISLFGRKDFWQIKHPKKQIFFSNKYIPL